MSTITPHYRSVSQLLQNQSFSIDEYQREYKWEKENIQELLGDLLDKFRGSYQPGHETSKVAGYADYFLGSIIVSRREGKSFLVDGQQRVTSLTLLLIYLYRTATERGNKQLEGSLAPLIFSDNFGVPKFNLDIAERLPVIEALFTDKPFAPDGKDESIQTMYARYQDIQSSELASELGEGLAHFTYWLMAKVGLIEIATDDDAYAYAIFETMNDRGKPLSPVDMLKAYLLAPVSTVEKRRAANQGWKHQVLALISWQGEPEPERDANCIKAWLRSQHAETFREKTAGSVDKDWELIGSSFHRWARDHAGRLGLGTEEKNLERIRTDFPFFAKAYLTVLEASRTYTPGLEAVFYNAHNEFTWQNTALLAPLCVSDDDATVRRKIALTATYLDIWLMRRVTNYMRVAYSSTSYPIFLLCRDIRRKSVDELTQILLRKLDSDEVTFRGYEAKERRGVESFGIHMQNRRHVLHLLARLTAYVEVQSGKPDLFHHYVDRERKNPFDIEHLWAKHYEPYRAQFATAEDFAHWRHNVAGLVLLPADVNRSYQDKPFEEKAPHYAKHNLYAASLTPSTYEHQPQFEAFRLRHELPFKSYASFGKAEQEERRKLVQRLVEEVWSPRRLQFP